MGHGPEKVLPVPATRTDACEILDDVGHFVHIEQPDQVAELVLDLVGRNCVSAADVSTDHNNHDAHAQPRALALHHLREGDGRAAPAPARPGRSGRRPRCRHGSTAGTGPIAALDFTGHGESTIPVGGGYTAEILLADADIGAGRARAGHRVRPRPRRLRRAACSPARARPTCVGTILADGPGLAGGGHVPDLAELLRRSRRRDGPPDPYALVEMSRDLRPPDYAAAFVRLALAGSPLDEPITRHGRLPPAVAGGRRRRARRRGHHDPRGARPLRLRVLTPPLPERERGSEELATAPTGRSGAETARRSDRS